MPLNDLKSSIERLGGSFIGASPIGSTTLWGLDPFSGGSTAFAYGDMTDADHNVRIFMRVDQPGTSPGTPNAHVVLARGICHLVVDRLPDAALPELLESLKTMFEFYGAPHQPDVSLPSPRRVLSAKVTGRRETRPLSFDAE